MQARPELVGESDTEAFAEEFAKEVRDHEKGGDNGRGMISTERLGPLTGDEQASVKMTVFDLHLKPVPLAVVGARGAEFRVNE